MGNKSGPGETERAQRKVATYSAGKGWVATGMRRKKQIAAVTHTEHQQVTNKVSRKFSGDRLEQLRE